MPSWSWSCSARQRPGVGLGPRCGPSLLCKQGRAALGAGPGRASILSSVTGPSGCLSQVSSLFGQLRKWFQDTVGVGDGRGRLGRSLGVHWAPGPSLRL